MNVSRRKILSLLFGSLFICYFSFSQNKSPEEISKEIVAGIEKNVAGIKEGKFVLICFIKGSTEIVSAVKFVDEWDDEYRRLLEKNVFLAIKRGGTVFKLLQIKEENKEMI